jgi:hypothetical protein
MVRYRERILLLDGCDPAGSAKSRPACRGIPFCPNLIMPGQGKNRDSALPEWYRMQLILTAGQI